MKKIVLASRNKKKIGELRTLLKEELGFEVEVLSLDDIKYYIDIEETGKTFEENAMQKASVPAKMGYIGVADDSGLCVDALGGAPGIYSARYSGGILVMYSIEYSVSLIFTAMIYMPVYSLVGFA